MPSINVNIQVGGPLFAVFIGVSAPRGVALVAAGQPTPSPVSGTFLLDTGASCTVVDNDLIQTLGLRPTGQVRVSTPSTPAGSFHVCDQYDVSLFIPGNNPISGGYFIPAMPIVTTHLKSQGIGGLIGRDILNNCAVIYNGSMAVLTLAY